MRKADEKIGDLALFNVDTRLIHFLLNLSKRIGTSTKDGVIIKEIPSQQQIADSIGASRESVSRILNKLSKKGYVNLLRRGILLKDKLFSDYSY